MAETFTVGLLGASDVQNYSCREWPQLLVRALQIGKSQRVRRGAFGTGGSVQHLADGSAQRLASQRVDAAVLSFFKDSDNTMGISAASSLTNMYAIIDMVRAQRANTAVFLLKPWRMPAAQEAARFPSIATYWANYATVVANRANVSIIDAYTAWGDPASNPSEFDPADQIHPLVAGLQRVTIPQCKTALASLVS